MCILPVPHILRCPFVMNESAFSPVWVCEYVVCFSNVGNRPCPNAMWHGSRVCLPFSQFQHQNSAVVWMTLARSLRSFRADRIGSEAEEVRLFLISSISDKASCVSGVEKVPIKVQFDAVGKYPGPPANANRSLQPVLVRSNVEESVTRKRDMLQEY